MTHARDTSLAPWIIRPFGGSFQSSPVAPHCISKLQAVLALTQPSPSVRIKLPSIYYASVFESSQPNDSFLR